MRMMITFSAFAGFVGLSACAQALPPTTPSVSSGECRPDAAKALEGQVMPGEADIKARTGATTIRTAGPDGMLTQDFRVERVTLIVDPTTKTILRANCG